MMESSFVVLENNKQVAKFKYRSELIDYLHHTRPDAWDYLDFKKKSHPKQIWQWHAEKYIKENWEEQQK